MFHLYDKINNNEVYFIAEMSANHGDDIDNAKKIIREAAEAGADCIKLQTYTADSLTINCDKEPFMITGGLWDGYKLYNLYTDAATPYEWHKELIMECEKCGVDFLSTPFDNGATDFLDSLGVEAYKIASFELVDIPLIEYAASKRKPMIMSCGMATIDEIQDAIDACKNAGNDKIVLLKCCSEYPAPWGDMKLLNIPDMKERFQVPVGLSDHSVGSLGAVVGTVLGACVIEKHVKIDGIDSADTAFSMTMSEFKQMVEDVKAAKMMMDGPDYSLTNGEKASTVFRRSLFAVKDIKAGEEFTKDNIRSIRPGNGIKPKYYKSLIGTNTKRDIDFGEPVTMEDIPDLRTQFNADMELICRQSMKEIGYTPSYFIKLMTETDGLDAAHKLVGKKEWSDGLTRLWNEGRWDLTIESRVLMDKYKVLFSDEEIRICEEKKTAFEGESGLGDKA